MFACGSISTASIRYPFRTNVAAKLIVMVVFPTPPFCWQIAMTYGFFMFVSSCFLVYKKPDKRHG